MKKGKRTPYLADGKYELGKRVVDDPFEKGRRFEATVNVRESSIDHMFSRGRIDISQKLAGDRFRRLWELAAVGRNQAIDTTKEPVDGGGIGSDPISDELVRAAGELAKVMDALGPVGSQLIISLVGEGQRVEDVAARWSRSGGVVRGERAQGYVTARMVEALDQLVSLWRLESSSIVPDRPQTYLRNGQQVEVRDDIRSSSEGWSGPAKELSVGRFGDIVESSERPVDKTALTRHVQSNR